MIRNNRVRFASVFFLTLLLLFSGSIPAALAQWQPNGLIFEDVIYHYTMLPTDDGGHWVIYDTCIDLEYYCGLVQRFNADGYMQLPEYYLYGGVSIVNPFGHNAEIAGAVNSDNGSIIVAFMSATLNPELGGCMYAQKISPEGELLWGDSGAVAFEDDVFQGANGIFPSICSDEEGGFWGFYRERPYCPMYLYGVNEDGSQKLTRPTYIRYTEDGPGNEAILIAHPDGGVYVVYEDFHGTPYLGLMMKRFTAEGEEVWNEPVLVMPRIWGGRVDLKRYNDNSVVVFNAELGGDEVYLNRISEDGETMWGDFLDLSSHGSGGSSSNPVLLADNSLFYHHVWIMGADWENRLYRITEDGAPYYYGYWYMTFEPPMRSWSLFNGLLPSTNPNRIFSYNKVQIPGRSNTESSILCQLLDIHSGMDSFADDTVLVDFDSYHINNSVKAMLLPDSSGVIIVSNDIENYSFLNMYKVLMDGTVVGHESSVDEIFLTIPETFTISSIHPNPFNSSVLITIELSVASTVTLKVSNLEGRILDRRDYTFNSGEQQVSWSAPPDLASGTLFFSLSDGTITVVRRVILEK